MQTLFKGRIKRNRGVNELLFKLLEKFKNQFNLTNEEALFFVIKLYKNNGLSDEDKQLLEKWLNYQKLKMEERINNTVNRVTRQKAKSKNIKELIRNEYKRQKLKGIDNMQILKFLKDYFLNEDYLNNYGYDKKKINHLIVEVIKEEDPNFYLYLLELIKSNRWIKMKNQKENDKKNIKFKAGFVFWRDWEVRKSVLGKEDSYIVYKGISLDYDDIKTFLKAIAQNKELILTLAQHSKDIYLLTSKDKGGFNLIFKFPQPKGYLINSQQFKEKFERYITFREILNDDKKRIEFDKKRFNELINGKLDYRKGIGYIFFKKKTDKGEESVKSIIKLSYNTFERWLECLKA